jgi:hypothetical protein
MGILLLFYGSIVKERTFEVACSRNMETILYIMQPALHFIQSQARRDKDE